MLFKKEVKLPNRQEVNTKFKASLRTLKRSIDDFDAKIEAEVANAISYR